MTKTNCCQILQQHFFIGGTELSKTDTHALPFLTFLSGSLVFILYTFTSVTLLLYKHVQNYVEMPLTKDIIPIQTMIVSHPAV